LPEAGLKHAAKFEEINTAKTGFTSTSPQHQNKGNVRVSPASLMPGKSQTELSGQRIL
jgi:hypothetical protein